MKLWTALLCVLCVSTYTNCDAAVGTITDQPANPASILRSTKSLPGTKGTGVEMQDTINTTKGKVGITFVDDTRVEVNDSSKLVIDDFVYDPKKGSGKLAMNFAQGTVRYASGAVAHNNPNAVKINTPSATVAVRGTDFTATVDEVGASTIILLPSCPKGWADVDRDCKTGVIDVLNEAGSVTLNKPFQGTKVESRTVPPMRPTILNLTADTINNLLIVSPPKELNKNDTQQRTIVINQSADVLNVNFLKQNFLENVFDANKTPYGDNPLTQPLLQQYFLANIFDILAQQLQDDQARMLQNLIAPTNNALLPDYNKATGVVATIGVSEVTLTRSDGSNIQSVSVPKSENALIIQQQGAVSITNRVNAAGTTTITIKQN